MKASLYLVFPGTCREAFALYESALKSKIHMSMTYDQAPAGTPVPPDSAGLVLHIAMPIGDFTLMGCDAPGGHGEVPGGFRVCIEVDDEAEVKRIFAALSDGGSVQMPLGATFWSPLFGMLKDRFGVGWMVSVPGPQPS